MKTHTYNSKGFGIIEVFFVVVILAVVVGGGAYMYSKNHKKNSASSSNSSTQTNKTSTTPNLYAGWGNYTTKYEKLSFKYPSSWKLADASSTTDTDVAPGQDLVTLTAASGLQVSINAGGTMFDGGNPSIAVLSSTPIHTLGGTHYLVFTSSGSSNTTAGAVITTTNALPSMSNFPASKNIKLSASAVSGLPKPFNIISLQYSATTGSDVHFPLSTFQKDASYSDAKLIIESLTY